jgi:ATP-dependent RNA helicase DHX29
MDVNRTYRKEVDGDVVELDNIFLEDSSAWEAVTPETLKQ